MVGRVSTFSDPEVVRLLQTKFVSAAIDQWYQRKQKDAEGDFYRQVATGGRMTDETSQGLYVCTADGRKLGFINHPDGKRVLAFLRKALEEFKPGAAPHAVAGVPDPRFALKIPEGGLVIRVTSKVLGGYEKAQDPWEEIFQQALGRDYLWVRKDEHQALVQWKLLDSLRLRMLRFHLTDNTRGEPPMWEPGDVRKFEFNLTNGKLKGAVRLENGAGDRGYEAEILGTLEVKAGKVTRFDVVAKGLGWGAGPFTGRGPKGKFPFAVAFTLVSGQADADQVPPQGMKTNGEEYLR